MEAIARTIDVLLIVASVGLFVFFCYDWYKEGNKN